MGGAARVSGAGRMGILAFDDVSGFGGMLPGRRKSTSSSERRVRLP
jgi:hypothetical protein